MKFEREKYAESSNINLMCLYKRIVCQRLTDFTDRDSVSHKMAEDDGRDFLQPM